MAFVNFFHLLTAYLVMRNQDQSAVNQTAYETYGNQGSILDVINTITEEFKLTHGYGTLTRNGTANGNDTGNAICGHDELLCWREGKCISHWKVCDGKADCSDSLDEISVLCHDDRLQSLLIGLANSTNSTSGNWTLNETDIGNATWTGKFKECGQNEFYCWADKTCVPHAKVCDGIVQCSDTTDEHAFICGPNGTRGGVESARGNRIGSCEEYEFICWSDKQCIPPHYVCDGHRDCWDGSDEHHLFCSHFDYEAPETTPAGACYHDEFTCLEYHQCIPDRYVCDEMIDCFDGTDEAEHICTSDLQCPDIEWPCFADGACIPREWVCDGHLDCSDGQDEARCNATTASLVSTTSMTTKITEAPSTTRTTSEPATTTVSRESTTITSATTEPSTTVSSTTEPQTTSISTTTTEPVTTTEMTTTVSKTTSRPTTTTVSSTTVSTTTTSTVSTTTMSSSTTERSTTLSTTETTSKAVEPTDTTDQTDGQGSDPKAIGAGIGTAIVVYVTTYFILRYRWIRAASQSSYRQLHL